MLKRLSEVDYERASTLALFVFFVAIFVGAFQYHPMSRLFPVIVSALGAAMSAYHYYELRVRSPAVRLRPADARGEREPTPWEIARGLMIVLFSTLSFIFLGFWITSVGLIFVLPKVMGWRAKSLVLLGIVLIVVGSIAVLFDVVLRVPMPKGLILDWIFDQLPLQD